MITHEDPTASSDGFEDNFADDTILVDGYPPLYLTVMGVIFLAFAFVAGYAYTINVGSFAKPGPGLWIMAAAIIALLAWPFAFRAQQKYEIFRSDRVIRVLAMVGGLLAFGVLYPLTGFLIAGVVALVIISRYSAEEPWRNVAIISVATPAVLFFIFGYLFQVGLSALPGWMI